MKCEYCDGFVDKDHHGIDENGECIACKWGGYDDQMWINAGCPYCACVKKIKGNSGLRLAGTLVRFGEYCVGLIRRYRRKTENTESY